MTGPTLPPVGGTRGSASRQALRRLPDPTPTATIRAAEDWRQPAGATELEGRVLRPADLGAVIDLHRRVLAGLPAGLLNPETDAFFADHLEGAGLILGLVDVRGALVAYGVLGLPAAASAYNFGRDLDAVSDDLGRVAHLDGVAVAGPWRGLGLHRALSLRRLALARAAGRRHVVSTVAPLNLTSLRTVLGVGLRARAVRPMFAGRHLRLLMHLDLSGDPPLKTEAAVAVPLADTDGLRHALAAGRQGYHWLSQATGPALLLAAVRQQGRGP